jgi:predicted nuclease of predicted toxin-antitoxin system
MRFLADESCDFAVVRRLRQEGFDVVAVAEIRPRAEDSDVVDLAIRERRILLTEDKDFGQLLYAHGKAAPGVVFLRYPAPARKRIPEDAVRLVRQQGEKLAGSFVTMQPGRTRISRILTS